MAILSLPEPDWAIEGLLSARGLFVLYGDPEIGKTACGVGIAVSMASEQSFLGHPVRQGGPCVYVPYEGASYFGRRIGAWKIVYGCSLDVPVGVHTYRRPLNLLNPSDVRRFIAEYRDINPALVVLTCGREQWPGATRTAPKIPG